MIKQPITAVLVVDNLLKDHQVQVLPIKVLLVVLVLDQETTTLAAVAVAAVLVLLVQLVQVVQV
jgi:hypothetical protein